MLNFNQGSPFQFGKESGPSPTNIPTSGQPGDTPPVTQVTPSITGDTISPWQAGSIATSSAGFNDGPISIAEFSKIVQTILDKAKETQEESEIKDTIFNKGVSFRISYELQLLKMLGSRIFDIGQNMKDISSTLNSQIDAINQLSQVIYQGQAAAKQAAKDYNQAVANFNNPDSPDYQNAAKLELAKNNYDQFRQARQGEVDAYNNAVALFNAEIDSNNAKIQDLNSSRSIAGMPSLPLLEKAKLYQGGILQEAVLGQSVALPQVLAKPPDLVKMPSTSTADLMRQFYWPVHDSVIGFIREYTRTLDVSLSLNGFERFTLRKLLQSLPSIMLMQLATGALGADLSGKSQFPMGSPFVESIMRRVLSSALLNSISLGLGQNISKGFEAAIQLSSMALLARSALFASTLPALSLLGDRLSRLGLNAAGMNMALTAAFLGRIRFSTSRSGIRRSILNSINSDPALKNLSFGQKRRLAKELTKALQSSILSSAFLSAGIALGLPGLASQLTGLALQFAGVSGLLPKSTFNSLLNNRVAGALGQAFIASALIGKGLQEGSALRLTGKAIASTLALGPFPSAREFTTTLANQLKLLGIGNSAFAKSLAIDFTASLLAANPRTSLSGSFLDASLFLGLINRDLFLTNAAVNQVLTGLEPALAGNYSKTVDALLSNKSLASSSTLREVRSAMVSDLVSQGVSHSKAWRMANNFVQMIKNGEAFSLALSLNNPALNTIRGLLALSLVSGGFNQSVANTLIEGIIQAALTNPAALSGANFSNHAALGLILAGAGRQGLVEKAVAQALVAKGYSLEDSLKAAGAIAGALFINPAVLSSTQLLRGSLTNALVSSGLNLSPREALNIAKELAKDVHGITSNAENLLTRALVNTGIPRELAKEIASTIKDDFSSGELGLGSLQRSFSDAISKILVAGLLFDSATANSIASSLILDDIFKRGPLSTALTEKLFEGGFARDELSAKIAAETIINLALRIPDALSSDTALRKAIITAAALTLDVDMATARDVAANITLNSLFQKETLKEQLTEAFLKNGVGDANFVKLLASLALDTIFNNSASPEDGFKLALQSYLFANGLPLAASLGIANGLSLEQFITIGIIQNELKTALLNGGKYSETEADQLVKQVILLVLSNPQSYQGEASFKEILSDILFAKLGLDESTAKEIAFSLVLDNLVNRDDIRTNLKATLIANGLDPKEADLISIKLSETFFPLGNPGIEGTASENVVQLLALAQSLGGTEVTNYILASLLSGKLIEDPDLRNQAAKQIALSVLTNPLSFESDQSFREVFRDAILSNIGSLDVDGAEKIAYGLQISDAIRLEVLKQAILYAGA